ncbi:MAG TPA: hypothetical protein VKZ53_26220 [Candidatus Angelobacter sp.]|nr:hypothetical protein [Candidatus Angelobacter sp.]
MALIGVSIGLAFLAILLAWKAASAQTMETDVGNFAWDVQELETVVETFAVLVEPDESAYMRKSLGPRDYLHWRRAQAASARKCLKHIGNSASFVLGLDMEVHAAEGLHSDLRHLTRAAVRTRLIVSLASAYLYLVWLFPQWMFFLELGISNYRDFLQEVRTFPGQPASSGAAIVHDRSFGD